MTDGGLQGARSLRNVLLLGRFGPPLLTFARSCARAGVRPFLLEIGPGGDAPSPRWLCRYLAGVSRLDPSIVGTGEGLERVRQVAAKVQAEALVAGSDAHILWLARERAAFEPECRLLAPPAELLEGILSKEVQIQLAKKVGLEVLPTFLLHSEADARAIPRGSYPLCLRPSLPGAAEPGFKAQLARHLEDLLAFLRSLRAWRGAILAQPFVEAPNFVVHGACTESGELLALRGFLVPRKFEGVSLTMAGAQLPASLERACEAFVKAAGIMGVFHFDLLADDKGEPHHFLEVNVRVGGTTDKAYRLGYDEPALHLRSFGYAVVWTAPTGPPRLVANKRSLLKHTAYAVLGRLTDLDYPKGRQLTRAARSVYDLVFARDSVFDWRDLPGSLRFHLRPPPP